MECRVGMACDLFNQVQLEEQAFLTRYVRKLAKANKYIKVDVV